MKMPMFDGFLKGYLVWKSRNTIAWTAVHYEQLFISPFADLIWGKKPASQRRTSECGL